MTTTIPHAIQHRDTLLALTVMEAALGILLKIAKPGSKLARRLNHRQRALLLNALKHPDKGFTIAVHQRTHDVTYETARSDLRGLAALNLMRQHRQSKAFVFVAVPDLGKKLRG